METLDFDETKEEFKRRIFDLTTMLEIGRTLNTSLSLSDVLDIIILTCNGHFHASDAMILLPSEEGEQIRFAYSSGDTKLVLDSSHPFVDFMESSGGLIEIEEIRETDELKDVYEAFKQSDFQLIVPLRFKGQINGILMLKKKEEDFGTGYTKDEKHYIELIAGFASVAIENARLYQMATLDRKTRLYNHGYFQNRLVEEIERAERYNTELALIMLDLDHFKNINDTYGHMIGDEVLIKIAKTIQEQVRSFDIPSRFGGEEFCIILPETDTKNAELVSERLRKRVEELSFKTVKGPFSITVSIGISHFAHKKHITEDMFIEQADKALYFAKQNGRNQIAVYENIPR